MEKMNHEDMGMMHSTNSMKWIVGVIVVALVVGAIAYASGLKSGENKAMMSQQDAMMQKDTMQKTDAMMMHDDTMTTGDSMKASGDAMMK